jgi:hypothetical protein
MPVDASKGARAVRNIIYSVLAIVTFASFYLYYRDLIEQRRQTDLNSALTSLEVASDALGSKLSSWTTVVKNAAKASTSASADDYKSYIDVMVPGLDPRPNDTCFYSVTDNEVQTYLRRGQRTLQFDFVAKATVIDEKQQACAVTTRQDLLPSLLNKLPENVFEDVLLASDDGDVYYQFASIGPRISSLEGLLAAPATQGSETNSFGAWLGGLFGKGQPSPGSSASLTDLLRDAVERAAQRKVHDAASFSDLLKVQLGGEDYLLILQPVLTEAHIARSKDKPADLHLILVGLVRSHQLDAATSTLPGNVVTWILLGLVLVYSIIFSLSSVPMKPRLQPVHRMNIAWMVFFALTSCAGLTLACTHGFFVKFENDNEIKKVLESLGRKIDENVQDELCHFYHVLEAMTASEELTKAIKMGEPIQERKEKPGPDETRVVINLLAEAHHPNLSKIAYSYPFFDQVSWSTSKDGLQLAKWSIHPDVTSKVTMTQFPWFIEARETRLFHLRTSPKNEEQYRLLNRRDTQDVYVEPLVSPTTGEYLTLLVKPYRDLPSKVEDFVGFVIAPLISVNSPVFPPGYGFAVIRSDGTVLFNSNPDRNMRENLFRACGRDERLIQACQTRQTQTLRVTYAGRDVLLNVGPMTALEGANWTIITYRDRADDERAEEDTFTQSMELMVPYGLFMLVLVFLLVRFVARQSAQRLWPDEKRLRDYLRLVCILLLIFAFNWLLALDGSRTLGLVEVLILSPVVVFLAAAFLLGNKCLEFKRVKFDISYKHLAVGISCVYPTVALANVIVQAVEGRSTSNELGGDVIRVALALAVCALTLGSSEEIPLPEDGKSSAAGIPPREGWWAIRMYVFAVCIGVMLLSVLPTLVCYRVAFQMVRAAHSMVDLVKLNESLVDRTHSVERYYSDIHLAGSLKEKERFIADRLALKTDRYDLALPSLNSGRVEFPRDNGRPPLIDRFMARIPFLRTTTPAHLWADIEKTRGAAGLPEQFFLLCSSPFVQFSHRLPPDLVRNGRWNYNSIAVTVPDPGTAVPWGIVSTVILAVLVLFATYKLVNLLFFLKFKPAAKLEKMGLSELAGVNANIVLLTIAGSLDVSGLDPKKVQYVDSRRLEGASVNCETSSKNKTVVFGNFDLSWDSEETAAQKLTLLENLLFSAHARVVLLANIDPVEYIAEVISDDSALPSGFVDFFRTTESRWNRVFLCFEHRSLPIDVQHVSRNDTKEMDDKILARRIYASCTDAQRAVLYQIAKSGWVNPNNLRAISALSARGWVKLGPMPVFDGELGGMSEHSELIPELASADEIRRWDSSRGSSKWTTILTIGGAILLAGVLVAGKDIFQSIPGIITGLLAIAPGIWKTFSRVTTRASVEQEGKGTESV